MTARVRLEDHLPALLYIDGLAKGHLKRQIRRYVAKLTKHNQVMRETLEEIAAGYCCDCCDPGDPRCDVGRAKDTLAELKEDK